MPHQTTPFAKFTIALMLLGLGTAAVAQPTDADWPRSQWHDDMRYERTQGVTRQGWNGSGTKKPHQFNIVSAPYPVRYGTHSERFEIRPDDDNAMRDLGVTNGNRSELLQRPNVKNARIGEDAWFGWSFYHENLFAASRSYGWYPMLGQWKTDLDAPPVIAFTPAFDGGPVREYIGIHLNDLSRGKDEDWMAQNKYGFPCTRLFNIRISTGKWMDIVVNTNFSDGEDGYLNIWINSEKKCSYKGPIVSTPVDRFTSYGVRNQGPLFKRGYWSGSQSFPKRWLENHSDEPIPTFVVYYDEWRQGRSREEVDIRMIEAAGGPAVD